MLPAEIFASAIRGHWAVENENHWVRDVTLAEDASRIRVNPSVWRAREPSTSPEQTESKTLPKPLWSGADDPAVTLSYRGL